MELTKKEQELMEVLWKAGRPLSSKEIVENGPMSRFSTS